MELDHGKIVRTPKTLTKIKPTSSDDDLLNKGEEVPSLGTNIYAETSVSASPTVSAASIASDAIEDNKEMALAIVTTQKKENKVTMTSNGKYSTSASVQPM